MIIAWLIRASILLKETLRHELQEHPVLTFNIHQLGGGVSFQHHSFVAFQEGVNFGFHLFSNLRGYLQEFRVFAIYSIKIVLIRETLIIIHHILPS